MRSIESEGDSIDEAIERALQSLGVDRDQAEIEILADATKGLFGFGGKKARVKATVRAPLVSGLLPIENHTASDDSGAAHDSRETVPSGIDARQRPVGRRVEAPTDEAFRSTCQSLLTQLLSHVGVDCTITPRPTDDPGMLILDVTGDSGGLLIGRRGQTLDAIEYVLNRMATRHDGPVAGRVMIDVERYRERRREYLTTLAHRLAEKVKLTGRTVALNPMSPRDRRFVHLALQGDTAVATRSHGEGHFRKLLIVPADRPRRVRERRPSA